MLAYHTAGHSHGEMLIGILEGFPAHVPISLDFINRMLERRQGGYGRSKRQNIEKDEVEIIAGVWKGNSTGAPIGMMIKNKASSVQGEVRPRTIPRPGHTDLAGAWKYGWEHDFNPVIERSSARETAMRVAVGATCQLLLQELGVEILGHVRQLGSVIPQTPELSLAEMRLRVEDSPFYCCDPKAEEQMRELVDGMKEAGNSLGGVVEVLAENVPPGLGGFRHQEFRLDAQLAQALMSIPSVKAVEIGEGLFDAERPGSEVHDAIKIENGKIRRTSNNSGGIEGGISNGERIIVRAYHKPIPTMIRGIESVDLKDGSPAQAPYVRSDVVVIPAASVVAEAMVSFVLARALLAKFGQDHLEDIRKNLDTYLKRLKFY
ncbi:MAG: chorismate synthase [Planctomycetota bacterium]|jgi:chorismate synthase